MRAWVGVALAIGCVPGTSPDDPAMSCSGSVSGALSDPSIYCMMVGTIQSGRLHLEVFGDAAGHSLSGSFDLANSPGTYSGGGGVALIGAYDTTTNTRVRIVQIKPISCISLRHDCVAAQGSIDLTFVDTATSAAAATLHMDFVSGDYTAF